MDTPRFIEAFKALPTHDSRHQALEALVRELTPYEWRALQTITSARLFQFDIIGQLPIELVAHIFSYLDTTTPCRLQRVSTRWAQRLRSPDVLKQSLNQWFTGTITLQSADYALCTQKARLVHNHRHGKPTSLFDIRLEEPIAHPSLAGDTLIWLTPEQTSRSIALLDLGTWNLRIMSGEAREELRNYVASDQLVAVTTFSHVCYVWPLHGQGRKAFRVPSHDYFGALACRGRTVACAASFHDHIAVCIWDYDTQRARSFQITPDPSHLFFRSGLECKHKHNLALLLQPNTKTILVFGDVQCSKAFPGLCSTMPGPILYTRLTYDGQVVHSSHMPLLKGITSITMSNENSFVPVDQNGRFLLRMNIKNSFRLHFDEQLGQFTKILGPDSEDLVSCFTSTWWKDSFYKVGNSTGRVALEHEGTRGAPNPRPLIFDVHPCKPARVGVNENFVMCSQPQHIYLLCFDDSDKRPKQCESFFDIGYLTVLDRPDHDQTNSTST
ncbi:uncharacterized protein K460DRAFT_370364 [Cucurbitaria berberidis CBS 394.84]|uniref:F-box domain-containing protein n=1 Tax=Cucurbitaria berberidis CBS 394.84 TaxID=1168544 RepID=A0A9P4GBI4_9PLEO|nr:uncharacterized protein K460DRAFT_370364 [Cucurbitaria berberidis CBS 394.84]KAF1842397.1 hypothetical protein K460DRAFT_370364 [Cucurbitaria berberidis CBS 394.84]